MKKKSTYWKQGNDAYYAGKSIESCPVNRLLEVHANKQGIGPFNMDRAELVSKMLFIKEEWEKGFLGK